MKEEKLSPWRIHVFSHLQNGTWFQRDSETSWSPWGPLRNLWTLVENLWSIQSKMKWENCLLKLDSDNCLLILQYILGGWSKPELHLPCSWSGLCYGIDSVGGPQLSQCPHLHANPNRREGSRERRKRSRKSFKTFHFSKLSPWPWS